MKKTTYYKTLPDGYLPVKTIDAGDKTFGMVLNLAAFIIMAVVGVVTFLLRFVMPDGAMDTLRESMAALQGNIWAFEGALFGVLFAMLLYIVLHELTHGLAYKLLTGEKLTFGIKLSCAFCGVPDIYTTRFTSLIALLAPFTLFGILFLALVFAAQGWLSLLSLLLFAIHFGGCAGDLYDTCLLLFKFKGNVLVNDNGPKQVIYQKA